MAGIQAVATLAKKSVKTVPDGKVLSFLGELSRGQVGSSAALQGLDRGVQQMRSETTAAIDAIRQRVEEARTALVSRSTIFVALAMADCCLFRETAAAGRFDRGAAPSVKA
jgi:hypothetical protein